MFDWVTGFLQDTGYVGIAFLMLLENVFPHEVLDFRCTIAIHKLSQNPP